MKWIIALLFSLTCMAQQTEVGIQTEVGYKYAAPTAFAKLPIGERGYAEADFGVNYPGLLATDTGDIPRELYAAMSGGVKFLDTIHFGARGSASIPYGEQKQGDVTYAIGPEFLLDIKISPKIRTLVGVSNTSFIEYDYETLRTRFGIGITLGK